MPDPGRLQGAMQRLQGADAVNRPAAARQMLSLIPPLLRKGRIDELAALAPGFDAAGGFSGTPWDRPARLRPRLWAGSFDADPPYPWLETMSTLRMLAIAVGDAVHEDVDAGEARRFLERVLSLNIDKIMDAGSEAARLRRLRHHDEAAALLRHVLGNMPAADILRGVGEEVDGIMAQRPVWTHHVRATLRLVSAIPGASERAGPLLDRYVEAVLGPTPISMRFRDPDAYAAALEGQDLAQEARAMGERLRSTGLACPQLAALLHATNDPGIQALALGLDDAGTAALHDAHEDVQRLLVTIAPSSAQTAYGLARCLERGLLQRAEVRDGLFRVLETPMDHLDIAPDEGLSTAEAVTGGLLRVLGQPLGIGQGNNPTCQSARGISLWAQYRPAHLIQTLMHAIEGDVVVDFDSIPLHSSQLGGGLAPDLDPELDPVSRIMVPHLDRLYDAMMRQAAGRGADPHQWVNPALYGRMVPPMLGSCFDPVTWHVTDHEGFLRRFFATYHPDHNAAGGPLHATPLGIAVTDDRARLLGLHAVTLQRVALHDGAMRAYFYNPNNEGRQDWGDGVTPSVRDQGELEGESSLPFDQLASRTYAFHHPRLIPGDPGAVPAGIVRPISQAARRSWGRAYVWAE